MTTRSQTERLRRTYAALGADEWAAVVLAAAARGDEAELQELRGVLRLKTYAARDLARCGRLDGATDCAWSFALSMYPLLAALDQAEGWSRLREHLPELQLWAYRLGARDALAVCGASPAAADDLVEAERRRRNDARDVDLEADHREAEGRIRAEVAAAVAALEAVCRERGTTRTVLLAATLPEGAGLDARLVAETEGVAPHVEAVQACAECLRRTWLCRVPPD